MYSNQPLQHIQTALLCDCVSTSNVLYMGPALSDHSAPHHLARIRSDHSLLALGSAWLTLRARTRHVQQHHAACGASGGARRQKRPDEVSRRETRRGKAMRASASSSRSVTPLPPSTMNARNGESVSPHHWTTTCARVVCRVGARTWRERSGERVGHWAKARKSRTRLGRARADRRIRGRAARLKLLSVLPSLQRVGRSEA